MKFHRGECMSKDKTELIIGLNNNIGKLMVQKSRPLLALCNSELTLPELKILDIYLSRINSHNPDKRTVEFNKGELEKLLNLQKINISNLKDRLDHLRCTVNLTDLDNPNAFQKVALFEEAFAEQDKYGLWVVRLTCTQKAMPYFFNIENIGYQQYRLRYITSLESRYAYNMLIYLEFNRFRKKWEVNLDEMKQILGCQNEQIYKQYKYFNNKLLKRIQHELFKKSGYNYTYEPVMNGRSVIAVKFTFKTLPKNEVKVEAHEIIIDKYSAVIDEARPLWVNAICDDAEKCKFNKVQIDEIHHILLTIPTSKLAQYEFCCGDIDLQRYHYMAQQYATLIRINSEKPIHNMFLYFVKMLRNDGKDVE